MKLEVNFTIDHLSLWLGSSVDGAMQAANWVMVMGEVDNVTVMITNFHSFNGNAMRVLLLM